jgi:hypothetical protein
MRFRTDDPIVRYELALAAVMVVTVFMLWLAS